MPTNRFPGKLSAAVVHEFLESTMRNRIPNAVVSFPGLLAIAAGVSGIVVDPIATGIIANEIHHAFRLLMDRAASGITEDAEPKNYLDLAARRSFIKAILGLCEARQMMLGHKHWLRFSPIPLGDAGDSEIAWLDRVRDDCMKKLADTERDDYQAPLVPPDEAFDFISTHVNRLTALSEKVSELALMELKIAGHGAIPPNVKTMILDGWPVEPEDERQSSKEKFTLFKLMCAFFAEEMMRPDGKASRAWVHHILKDTHDRVEDLSDKLWPKISELGEEASLRLEKLSAQTEVLTEQVSRVLRILTERQKQFDIYRAEQRVGLDELRRELAVATTYLVQISRDDERNAALRAERQRSLVRKCAGDYVAQSTEELIGEHRSLIGRETDLAQLAEFAGTPKQLILITAKPGNGKTALLANWVKWMKGQGSAFVAYHFFSAKYELRGWKEGLRNLLRQLYIYHGVDKEEMYLPSDINQLHDLLRVLIDEVADQPFVMVLDGLDEIKADFDAVSPRFALPLPKNVSLIASARADKDENPNFLREWQANAKHIHLGELEAEHHFMAWFKHAGNSDLALCAARPSFVDKVRKVTGGYPLYLTYLTQDLIDKANQIANESGKCETLEGELVNKPYAFTNYVNFQWSKLCEKELKNRRERNLFILLAIALGPMPQADVERITKLEGGDLRGLSPRVTRWFTKTDHLSNDGHYSFGHPSLAEGFASVIGREVSEALKRLLVYCERWREHKSSYALRYYAEHLRKTASANDGEFNDSLQTLYALARNEDFSATIEETFPDEPELSLHPIRNALLCAQDRDDAAVMVELMFLHHQRMKGLTNQLPLKVFRDTGNLQRALRLAHMLLDTDQEHHWALQSLGLAWELTNYGRHEEARQILCDLTMRQHRLVKLQREDWQTLAVKLLGETFLDSDECWAMVQDRLLYDRAKLDLCLLCLSKKPDAAAIDKLEQTIKIGNAYERVRGYLASAQAKNKDTASPSGSVAKTLERAKASAKDISDENLEAIAWALIARTQETCGTNAEESWTKAYETASGISDDDQKEHVFFRLEQLQERDTPFAEVSVISPGDCSQPQIYKDFEAALTGEGNNLQYLKKRVLQSIEQRAALSPIDRPIVQPPLTTQHESEETLVQSHDDPQASGLISSAVALVLAGQQEEALRIVSKLGNSDLQALVQRSIASALAESRHYEQALFIAAHIGDPYLRARPYGLIARMQLKDRCPADALTTAELIGDDELKAKIYIEIAVFYVRTGHDDEAIKTAARLNDYWQASGLEAIALAQVEEGRDNEARKTIDLISDNDWKARVISLIAQAQAVAGRENDALETTQSISLNREYELPKVAQAFVQARGFSGFKKLLLPSSYYLSACYEMAGYLAELYPAQAAGIADILKERD